MSEDIKSALLTLPNEIASMATKMLELQTGKSELDIKISEIETAVKFQVGTDASLKNDTARRGATRRPALRLRKEISNDIARNNRNPRSD